MFLSRIVPLLPSACNPNDTESLLTKLSPLNKGCGVCHPIIPDDSFWILLFDPGFTKHKIWEVQPFCWCTPRWRDEKEKEEAVLEYHIISSQVSRSIGPSCASSCFSNCCQLLSYIHQNISSHPCSFTAHGSGAWTSIHA